MMVSTTTTTTKRTTIPTRTTTTTRRKQKRRVVATGALASAAAAAATTTTACATILAVAILSRTSELSVSRSVIGVEGFRPLPIPSSSSCDRTGLARYHDADGRYFISSTLHRPLSPSSYTTSSSSSFTSTTTTTTSCLWSSIGGGSDPPRPPSNNNNNNNNGRGGDDDDGLGDFLDPQRLEESESLKRAREYMSETSLPISFDKETNFDKNDVVNDSSTTGTDDSTNNNNTSSNGNGNLTPSSSPTASSSTVNSATSSALFGTDGSMMRSAAGSTNSNETSTTGGSSGDGGDLLAKNPYMQVVSQISPSELISKFTATANPRVQDAVRTTILGLIGSLPKLAFETTSITTGQRLASLMFQLQMTGYMFKNAEYRMSMQNSLGIYSQMSSNLLLTGSADEGDVDFDDDDYNEDEDPLLSGKIKGKIKVHYGGSGTGISSSSSSVDGKIGVDGDSSAVKSNDGIEIEVDAAAYMSELRSEVKQLRDELTASKQENEAALQQDLLMYIRTLPAQELKSLTNTMSQDVLVCMKGLVQAVLAGIGDGQIGPETVTEQSGEAMAQLCMWQLAVGYNLRELEVREEMKKNLSSLIGDVDDGSAISSSSDGPDGTPPSSPGAFE